MKTDNPDDYKDKNHASFYLGLGKDNIYGFDGGEELEGSRDILGKKDNVDARVLIAEDNVVSADLMGAIIGNIGKVEISIAVDGREALDLISGGNNFDLVILDIMMPKVNGLDVLKELRKEWNANSFPILLVSALNDCRTITTGIDLGANDYIVKPIVKEVFRSKVISLINQKKMRDLLEHTENILSSLITVLEARDFYTKGHSERVSSMAFEFGMFLELPDKDISVLKRAGLLHDIGKIGIPDLLLQKKGRLKKSEFDVIRNHSLISCKICSPMPSFFNEAEIIKYHHERFDGKGYPGELKGEEIPYLSRILAIVDSFDAMTSERPYRDAYSGEEALNIFRNEILSGQWDPDLSEKFIKFLASSNN